jgi:diaminopimelate decarboxylase
MDNYLENINFFETVDPFELVKMYGTPVYIYSEKVLRQRCQELKNLLKYPNFDIHYSVKTNNNIELLKIIRDEGLSVDAMSPGEIYTCTLAGYPLDRIYSVCNNVTAEEMKYAGERGIVTSVDSLMQLDLWGQTNPGSKVAVRYNPGVGAGHHEKVITAGRNTKFGVSRAETDDVKVLLKKYDLILEGINLHIGSLFLDHGAYLEAAEVLMEISEQFESIRFLDFGGGFGIPYQKHAEQPRLDLDKTGKALDALIENWTKKTGWQGMIVIEPGRFVAAECGVLLGTVNSIKTLYDKKYIGTDLGFNRIPRPVMYDAYHEVEVYRQNPPAQTEKEVVQIVGNICETGDYIAKDRELPKVEQHDLVAVMDAGAYCYSMSSNYNLRERPAEVLINNDGSHRLIRKRDTLEDMVKNCLV